MSFSALTDGQVQQFHVDGYVIVPEFLTVEEVGQLAAVARADLGLQDGVRRKSDSAGRETKLAIRYELGDDVYSAIMRSRRLVGAMERLLGGPVCHFHHKMMLKEPFTGGAWEWHQDYGYWYRYEGFLFPDLASCMIAVDRADRTNGCLQVLRGSHRLGRIEHVPIAEQTGADPARVAVAEQYLERVYVELDPGAAVFFHSNLLHRSDANDSPNPRWTLIGCYYAASNPACNAPQYTGRPALIPEDDATILATARRQLESLQVG